MKTYIIAEGGINHNRSLANAKFLAQMAKTLGADVFKTQLEIPPADGPVYCLTYAETVELYEYCVSIDMPFACTAFDVPTLEFLLANTKMEFIKIASCDNLNVELLDVADKSDLPVIQSLKPGAMYYSNALQPRKLLHVVAEYPTPLEHCNLSAVRNMHGLSDHSGNPLVAALAVAAGAGIVECHLTPNKGMDGPDHKASLNSEEFAQMVKWVRMAERAL